MEAVSQFIPLAILIAIIYFAILRPIRRRMSQNDVSLFDAIPTWAYFLVAVVLVGYSVAGDLYIHESAGEALFDRETAQEVRVISSLKPVLISFGVILFAAGIYRATRK